MQIIYHWINESRFRYIICILMCFQQRRRKGMQVYLACWRQHTPGLPVIVYIEYEQDPFWGSSGKGKDSSSRLILLPLNSWSRLPTFANQSPYKGNPRGPDVHQGPLCNEWRCSADTSFSCMCSLFCPTIFSNQCPFLPFSLVFKNGRYRAFSI